MEPVIELKDVSFGYGSQFTVSNVSLHLHQGQFAALVGPSGAGKTTLLKLILGTLKPQHGTITTSQNGAIRRIGYVPQLETVDWQFPVTVEEVVQMGRIQRTSLWPWPSRDDRRRVHEVLERLEISRFADHHIRDLSGGQQQRVFLARALVAEPDLLVLDEPTSGVDMNTVENVLHLLGELNQTGITILLTTHDLNAAAAHIPWVICLNRKVIAQGKPEDVFTDAIMSATYQSSMLVLRHDNMIFVHQKPHHHHYRDMVPNPVPGDHPDENVPQATESSPDPVSEAL